MTVAPTVAARQLAAINSDIVAEALPVIGRAEMQLNALLNGSVNAGDGRSAPRASLTGLATGWRYVPNKMSHNGVTPPKFESCSSRAIA